MNFSGTYFPVGVTAAIADISNQGNPSEAELKPQVFSFLNSMIRVMGEARMIRLHFGAAAPSAPDAYTYWLTPPTLDGATNSMTDGTLVVYDPDANDGSGGFVDPTPELFAKGQVAMGSTNTGGGTFQVL